MSTPPIIRAVAADADAVAGLIAEAFHSLDVAAWLVPDPQQRYRALTGNFAIHVEHALRHGEIHLAADRSAVAVWFPRTRPLPEPEDYDQRLAAACAEATGRFQTLDALFDANHPTIAHHHLAFLAVAPDRQGSGLGSALLDHHHGRLDARSIPAYLEASCARSRDLYHRHGYGSGDPFTLPDGGPPLWPMWREPRPPAADAATALRLNGRAG